ncbi:MAG: hypothetical protein KC933_07170 [Myxococcales bacterium]|nr:hypothetical protein [Myxococcales bacterium]
MKSAEAIELFRASRLTLSELRAREPSLASVVEAHLAQSIERAAVAEDLPLGSLPGLQPVIDLGRLHLLVQVIKLDAERAEALAAVAPSPEAANDTVLSQLVKDKTLQVPEAQALAAARLVFLLSDDDEAVTQLLGKADVPAVLALRPTAWADAVAATKAKPPEGYTQASWGDELARRHAALAPSLALHGRLLGALKDEAVPPERVAAAWPGFALDEIAADLKLTPAERRAKMAVQLEPVARLRSLHPDVDWLALDYGPGSEAVKGLELGAAFSKTEQASLLTALKAQQRVHGVSADVDATMRLLEAGYHGAPGIALSRVGDLAAVTGLGPGEAGRVHAAATEVLGVVATMALSVHDLGSGPFAGMPVGNVPAEAVDYLRQLPGYSALFGSQGYCDCRRCSSLLGPVAYFVDLMAFVDRHVREGLFTTDHPEHVLDLKVRRPDLWTLTLTCESAETSVPTLEVVNEILENFIASNTRFGGALTDRRAVQDHVYRATLNNELVVSSLVHPFHLPEAQVGLLLAHAGEDRVAVAAVTGATATRAQLGLPARAHALTFTANEDLARLLRLFDVDLGAGDPVDVQDFLRATGLTRAELTTLIGGWFVRGGDAPRIASEKSSPASVQNDVERLHGLTPGVLDRLHRFVRLARGAGLTLDELDLLMQARGLAALDAAVGEEVARLLAVRRALGSSIEQALALAGTVPSRPLAPGGRSLFERRFNPEPLLGLGGRLPQAGRRFVHPAFRAAGAAPDVMAPRIAAGVGLHEAELAQLIGALRAPLAIADDALGFPLTAENLGHLYRHAALARALRLGVPQLFQLLSLVPGLPAPHVSGLDDLDRVLGFLGSWRRGRRTLDEIGLITEGEVIDSAAWPAVDEVVQRILDEGPAAFRFADTVFAGALGVTEAESRALVAANRGRLEDLGDGWWRLRSDYVLGAAPALPAGLAATEAQVQDVLRAYHPVVVLPERLARALQLDAVKAAGILALTGHDLAASALVDAVRADAAPAPLAALVDVFIRLTVLLRPVAPEAPLLMADDPSLFELGGLPDIPVEAVWAVDRYARLTAPVAAAFGEPELGLSHPEVHALLATHGGAGFPSAQDSALASLLRVQAGQASSLRSALTPRGSALETLERLADGAALAGRLQVAGEVLPLLLSDRYDEVAQAAAALEAGVSQRYPDDETRAAQLEPVKDALRALKRDALCSFLLRSLARSMKLPWRTRADLYQYFLLDVEMGGCGRTSRLVAATASVQLYVHRIRMNLEQDERAEDDPARVHVTPDRIPAGEWAWRKNYRVWEANRKVFLWPENYLEPDLRDDKTPQFEALESTLLQQEINEQTVLDAYVSYAAGFEALAGLRIGGCWYEADGSRDRLHLFGATRTDPPVWYYRAVDNLRFSRWGQADGVRWWPWVEVGAKIPVREVAPVVYRGRLHVFWVELQTRSVSSVQGGGSVFLGYDHTVRLKFTTLRLDGTWSPAQDVALKAWPSADHGVVADRFEMVVAHTEPRSSYTLRGALWERVALDTSRHDLFVQVAGGRMRGTLDLAARTLLADDEADAKSEASAFLATPVLRDISSGNRTLYVGSVGKRVGHDNALAAALHDERWLKAPGVKPTTSWYEDDQRFDSDYLVATTTQEAELHAVPRSSGPQEDLIIEEDRLPLLFHGSALTGTAARLIRLGTGHGETVTSALGDKGVGGLLATSFQEMLREPWYAIHILQVALVEFEPSIPPGSGAVHALLRGPYGAWYQELLFHIPWRIAQHLNAQGRYEAAQAWFHYLFDPTASEPLEGLAPAVRAQRLRDRVWRYAGFREQDVPTLRAVLTDGAAIEAYKADPFNPHAIARLRPTAYQKHIVMRYVSNLLDWADALFTEFTTESINEAVLLYTLASDVLGPRPPQLGACGETPPNPRDYAHIAPLLAQAGASEFLTELQTFARGQSVGSSTAHGISGFGVDVAAIGSAKDPARRMAPRAPAFAGPGTRRPQTVSWGDPSGTKDKGTSAHVDRGTRGSGDMTPRKFGELDGKYGWTLVSQISPVFCVPVNRELLAYWGRVEDRLAKIRSCRDINGVPRVPPLFAPEIDPRLLVRAKAQGISLEEVVSGSGGALPPYRFSYLIEKAKAMASQVASFGAGLLSALEKKDAEALSRLRLVQQQNLARLTTQQRRWEIEVAEESLAAVERQIEATEYRKQYYEGLLDESRTGWEVTQSVAVHTASISRGLAATLAGNAGILHLIPQLGSPLAMKYGGAELGTSASKWSDVARDTAGMADLVASSAGLEAGFDRRQKGWDHERTVIQHELGRLEREREVARLRLEIARRALELHEEDVAQTEETFSFYESKFTGLGLYTWLSVSLQRAHRGAYVNALAMARLADEAYRYERGTTESLVDASYWDAARGGLGAGDQLLLALQSLERRYIETNHRGHEVEQAFSLRQIDPQALLQLRETGVCEFDAAELFFDLAYPGHYRRRIRAVRLTIPCVTGPYVNISAVLSLVRSHIRSDPSAPQVEFPVQRSVSVATSSAQSDAGVFELSFRDERYMPFEGAGAVSRWRLELPTAFRPFEYRSIHDVVLSIAYTAEYDGELRRRVETGNAAAERSLQQLLRNDGVAMVFSLRQEAPDALHRLLEGPEGVDVDFELTDAHLPFYLAGRTLEVTTGLLGVELVPGANAAGLALSVDGDAVGLAPEARLGGVPGGALGPTFSAQLLGPHSVARVGPTEGVRDLVLYVELRLAP